MQSHDRRPTLIGRLARRLHGRRRGDIGAAMASVAMLGTALVLVTGVIVVRSVASFEAGTTDRSWEEAIFVAESGTDETLYGLTQDEEYMKENKLVVEDDTPLGTREEVLAAAEEVIDDEPTALRQLPEGEFVVFKPESSEVLYGVAYTPSRAAEDRHERVVVVEYQTRYSGRPWLPDHGLLADGDIVANGGTFTGANGSAHTNGDFQAGATTYSVCATGAGNQAAVGPDCPALPIEVQWIPEVDPLKSHAYSEYDVCRAGWSFGASLGISGLYAGPANKDSGTTPATPGVPCSGSFIPGTRNISGIGTNSVSFRDDVPQGAYYLDGVDATLRGKRDGAVSWTVIAGTANGVLDCSTTGGNIKANSQLQLQPAAAGKPYAIVAGGDVQFNGGADIWGLVATHEHLFFGGNLNVNGSIVAEGACDSAGSPERYNRVEGDMSVHYNGEIVSDFILKDRLGVDVLARNEMAKREL